MGKKKQWMARRHGKILDLGGLESQQRPDDVDSDDSAQDALPAAAAAAAPAAEQDDRVSSFLAEIAELVPSQSDSDSESDSASHTPAPALGKEQLRVIANNQDSQKPGKWVEAIDAATGHKYYWHSGKGATAWTLPADTEALKPPPGMGPKTIRIPAPLDSEAPSAPSAVSSSAGDAALVVAQDAPSPQPPAAAADTEPRRSRSPSPSSAKRPSASQSRSRSSESKARSGRASKRRSSRSKTKSRSPSPERPKQDKKTKHRQRSSRSSSRNRKKSAKKKRSGRSWSRSRSPMRSRSPSAKKEKKSRSRRSKSRSPSRAKRKDSRRSVSRSRSRNLSPVRATKSSSKAATDLPDAKQDPKSKAVIEALIAGLETRLSSLRASLNEPPQPVSPLDTFQIQLELRISDWKSGSADPFMLSKLNGMATQLHQISSERKVEKKEAAQKEITKLEAQRKAALKAAKAAVAAAKAAPGEPVKTVPELLAADSASPHEAASAPAPPPPLAGADLISLSGTAQAAASDMPDVIVLKAPPGVAPKKSASSSAATAAPAAISAPALSGVHPARLGQIALPPPDKVDAAKRSRAVDDMDLDEDDDDKASDVQFKPKKKKIKAPTVLPAALNSLVNKWNAISQDERQKQDAALAKLEPQYRQSKQQQQIAAFAKDAEARGSTTSINPNFVPVSGDWRQRLKNKGDARDVAGDDDG